MNCLDICSCDLTDSNGSIQKCSGISRGIESSHNSSHR
jgi:hypothetical protein